MGGQLPDGVSEAEYAQGDFFVNERLEGVAARTPSMEDIFASVAEFCGGTPLSDDCTVVELLYTGQKERCQDAPSGPVSDG